MIVLPPENVSLKTVYGACVCARASEVVVSARSADAATRPLRRRRRDIRDVGLLAW